MYIFARLCPAAALLFIAVGTAACKNLTIGGCEEVGQNTGELLDVGGGVISHSINELAGGIPDLPGMTIGIMSNADLLAGNEEDPLAQGPMEDPDDDAGVGAFCFLDTDVSGAEEGIAARLEEGDSGGGAWAPTVTGLAGGTELAGLQAAGEPVNYRGIFAVTHDAMDEVLGPMTGLSGEEMLERGILFGLVYAEPRSPDGGQGEPVEGVTVTPSDDSIRIVYPNSRFTGTSAETGKQGAFLAIPPEGDDLRSLSFTVHGAGGDSAWSMAGDGMILPGVLSFHPMFADE